jgi:hypothetical protein
MKYYNTINKDTGNQKPIGGNVWATPIYKI